MLYLILLLVVLVFLLVLLGFTNEYIYKHGSQMNSSFVLPDIIHHNFDNYKAYHRICDYATFVSMGAALAACLVTKQYSFIVLYVVLLMIAHLICRIMFLVTVLPDSKNGDCLYSKNLLEVILNKGSCNCLNVSGHLVTAGISLYIIYICFRHYLVWIPLVIVYMFLFFIIAASRNHYTIDVVNATILVLLLITNTRFISNVVLKLTGFRITMKD